MNDGTVHELHVPHALGSVERPMSDRDLEEKFSRATASFAAARFSAITTLRCGEENSNAKIFIADAAFVFVERLELHEAKAASGGRRGVFFTRIK